MEALLIWGLSSSWHCINEHTSRGSTTSKKEVFSLPLKSYPAHLMHQASSSPNLGSEFVFQPWKKPWEPKGKAAFPSSTACLLYVDKLASGLQLVHCSHGVEASGQPYHLAPGCTATEKHLDFVLGGNDLVYCGRLCLPPKTTSQTSSAECLHFPLVGGF